MSRIQTVNPATGEALRVYSVHGKDEIERILQKAEQAFFRWRDTGFDQRAVHLRSFAALLRERKETLARIAAEEMGKILKEGLAEIEKCASTCEYFALHAAEFLVPQPIKTEWKKSYIAFQPLGVILAIMPWNFPFWQVMRAVVPALTAGNAVVVKPASNTPACALELQRIAAEAGFPEGLFGVALVPGKEAGALIEHKLVCAVTLTGSTPAGREVARIAGGVLKKCVLELGGSDAYLVLEDADLALAAHTIAAGRLLNAGQSCIAAKRAVVMKGARAEFERLLLEEFRQARFGNPLEEQTTLGPLARQDLRDDLHEQVMRSREMGARCLIGGEVPQEQGAFYPPTLLADVKPGMPAYEEEMFGPVLAVIEAQDEEDALRIANSSPYGLGGGVFTRDLEKGEFLARERMESGSAFVNAFVRSDPRLPFGGVKDSGYGRELSAFGIREFVNIKSVVVA